AMLAQALYMQGHYVEAEAECTVSETTTAAEDMWTQVMWRGVRAKILARQGRGIDAEALAREAVRLAEPTDLLTMRADAQLDLAEVLALTDRLVEATVTVRQAIALYEQKGNIVSARRTRSWLAAWGQT
ncbi:MAG TPA: hypothetical protein VFQ77_01620, partial [Pseudonocardiaceae bacterium]|nr:hypothetical protein [Pseudonocardiaceae bacterium]